jgi:hypothetical protein
VNVSFNDRRLNLLQLPGGAVICLAARTIVAIFPLPTMGVCASCLGREKESNEDVSIECALAEEMIPDISCLQDENSRLLFDDPHSLNYGGFGDQSTGASQADPQDVQQESEALQKIVAQTSK